MHDGVTLQIDTWKSECTWRMTMPLIHGGGGRHSSGPYGRRATAAVDIIAGDISAAAMPPKTDLFTDHCTKILKLFNYLSTNSINFIDHISKKLNY
jgi:hypothetical protein